MHPALVRPSQRVVSGAEAIKAADLLRKEQSRRDLWPYEWTFPPPDAELVHAEGTVAVSTLTPGTQAQVLSYQVQNNYRFMLASLVQLYVGSSSFVPGDGNVSWVLDVNIPIATTSLQGYPIPGFSPSGIPKGGYQSGVFAPYPFPKPRVLAPSDTLRSKVTITSQITTGSILAIFDGWLLPL